MIFKFLVLAAIIFFIYILFFRKNRLNTKKPTTNTDITEELVECPTCNTFVSKKDAILSNGRYYCSQECLNNKSI